MRESLACRSSMPRPSFLSYIYRTPDGFKYSPKEYIVCPIPVRDDWFSGGEKMDGYCCGTYSGRGFLTAEEKVEMLKEYKEELDLESKGVGERIKELEKGLKAQ